MWTLPLWIPHFAAIVFELRRRLTSYVRLNCALSVNGRSKRSPCILVTLWMVTAVRVLHSGLWVCKLSLLESTGKLLKYSNGFMGLVRLAGLASFSYSLSFSTGNNWLTACNISSLVVLSTLRTTPFRSVRLYDLTHFPVARRGTRFLDMSSMGGCRRNLAVWVEHQVPVLTSPVLPQLWHCALGHRFPRG